MKTAVVLNTLIGGNREVSNGLARGDSKRISGVISEGDYPWANTIAGLDPVDELLSKCRRLVEEKDIYIIIDGASSDELKGRFTGYHLIIVDDWKLHTVFNAMYSACREYEDIVYWYIDAPLIDTAITKQMQKSHREEVADYTYGEGFPEGITPEVLRTNILPKLISLIGDEKKSIRRNSIFEVLSKDINSFDIETFFSPKDMRLERIQLFTSLKRTRLIVDSVVERKGFGCSFEELAGLFESEPSVTRTVPSYIEIEITNKTNIGYIYSPLQFLTRPRGLMPFRHFEKIFNKLLDFSENFYIAFSLLGEPLMHQDIARFIELVVVNNGVNLILETDGTLFTPDFSDYIHKLDADNLSIIFEVDAIRDDTYRKIRGGDLSMVERNIRYLLEKGVDNVYVQMVRMDVNEDEMLEFFEVWEREAKGAVIQKYNSYLNLLPSLSGSDLKPLERGKCWHLLRDLVIFWDGKVPRCKQDINGKFLLGNILEDTLPDIWKRGEFFWLDHSRKEYDEYCKICDEYFTFNF
ncbi:MAG: spiro-SPASM protein [Spirochaetota bacterium]|nr:MAG: spiro-SPASM protein [Spirochaetota bacterium]